MADSALPDDQFSDFRRDKVLWELPGLFDYTGYVLFFPALLAGPVFDYAEYKRWIDTTMFDIPSIMDPAKRPPIRQRRRILRNGTPATLKMTADLV